jgi:glycosyltransferase involved in cell wall biosynthesis
VAELISVIVATYNRADALDACLRGFARQSDRGFEVIVADDGSRSDTADLVLSWQGRLGVPLTHVWHEDNGFRLAEIRNRAILASQGANCVFIDGDCIPCRDYVAAHRALSESGWFVAGNRALLSREFTEQVLRDHLEPECWSGVRWLTARLRGDVNRIAPLLRLPLGPLRRLQPTNWRSARGGNLAIRRDDLDRIDGFDAMFSGWGREDSDVVLRLMRVGVRRKDGRFAAGVLHLWHPESDRSRLPGNDARLDEVMRGDRVRANTGLTTLAAAVRTNSPYAASAVP